jgi:hypothetical protein
MLKFPIAAVLLAAGAMLVATGAAQDTPAAKPSTSSSTTSKTPAKKTGAGATAAAPLTSRKQKFSYALGMNIASGLGAQLKKQGVEVDWNLLAQGLKDGSSGAKTRLTEDEAKQILTDVQNDVRKEQQEKMKEAADKNKKEGSFSGGEQG